MKMWIEMSRDEKHGVMNGDLQSVSGLRHIRKVKEKKSHGHFG